MDPGELDAAICDDACFPGDLGFGSQSGDQRAVRLRRGTSAGGEHET